MIKLIKSCRIIRDLDLKKFPKNSCEELFNSLKYNSQSMKDIAIEARF